MIFVTVGTHEQQFNRLIQYIDERKRNGDITENVMMQTGFCTYEPRMCEWKPLLSYTDMQKYMQEAHVIITHGGPSSFMVPLQMGKIPVVVPRQKVFGEHVNDHQLHFCHEVEKRYHNIIVAENVENLKNIILEYDKRTRTMSGNMVNHNEAFNEKLEKTVGEMFGC